MKIDKSELFSLGSFTESNENINFTQELIVLKYRGDKLLNDKEYNIGHLHNPRSIEYKKIATINLWIAIKDLLVVSETGSVEFVLQLVNFARKILTDTQSSPSFEFVYSDGEGGQGVVWESLEKKKFVRQSPKKVVVKTDDKNVTFSFKFHQPNQTDEFRKINKSIFLSEIARLESKFEKVFPVYKEIVPHPRVEKLFSEYLVEENLTKEIIERLVDGEVKLWHENNPHLSLATELINEDNLSA